MSSLVISKLYSHQTSSKESSLVDLLKTSQNVSYLYSHKFDESGSERLKNQSLVVRVNRSSFYYKESIERRFRTSFAEDVSILRGKPLPPQQDVENSLVVCPKPEEDVLDWDYYLKDPPFNPSTIIEVEIEYAGPREPMSFTDPWDE